MAYYKKSQAEYKKKLKQFKVQYSLQDAEEGERLEKYLRSTGQSANAYLKQLIKSDLDQEGFMTDVRQEPETDI